MQHVKAVGLMNREEENPRLKNPILPRCVESSLSGPVPQNTCGSCWLGTAQQFYLNMRGEGGSRVTSKSKGHTYTNQRPGHYLTHEHSHITRVVAAMDTCFDLTGAHQYGIAVDQWPRRTRVFFFVSRRAYMQSAMPSHRFNNKEHILYITCPRGCVNKHVKSRRGNEPRHPLHKYVTGQARQRAKQHKRTS